MTIPLFHKLKSNEQNIHQSADKIPCELKYFYLCVQADVCEYFRYFYWAVAIDAEFKLKAEKHYRPYDRMTIVQNKPNAKKWIEHETKIFWKHLALKACLTWK